MGTGAITGYIDVAQLALYAFWLFFFGLVLYLHRENKREGYPLESNTKRGARVTGFPDMPPGKTYIMDHGVENRVIPGPQAIPEYDVNASPMTPYPGSPLYPNPKGDPMVDGVGPAAWAIRRDEPDLTIDGDPKIVPMRIATDFHVDERDPDPRGKPVYGADDKQGGTVVDIWVDRSEPQIRYFEVDVNGRHVLLPITLSRISGKDGSVKVRSILAEHFARVPTLANPDVVTLQEEDRVVAYYGGGNMYALPKRAEPFV